MGAPVYQSSTDTDFATSVTSMAVNMPATVNVGDLLLAFVSVRNAGTWTKPSGWNDISGLSQAGGASVGKLNGFYKIAAGTEGGTTATWTASTGTSAAWIVSRVSDWHGVTPPEATTTSGDVSSANPPTLTPSWGNDNMLWFAVASNAATGETTGFTAAPSGFGDLRSNGASSGGSSVNVAVSTRVQHTTGQNPDAFTPNDNRYWAAATVAVRSEPTTRYLRANGDWDGAVWATTSDGVAGSASTPKADSSVYISANYTVTVSEDAECFSLYHTNGTLTLDDGIILHIGGENYASGYPYGFFTSSGSTARAINLLEQSVLYIHDHEWSFDTPEGRFALTGSNLTVNADPNSTIIFDACKSDSITEKGTFLASGKTLGEVIINLGGSEDDPVILELSDFTAKSLMIRSRNSRAHTIILSADITVTKLIALGSSTGNRLKFEGAFGTEGFLFTDGGSSNARNCNFEVAYFYSTALVETDFPLYVGSSSIGWADGNIVYQNLPKAETFTDNLTTAPANNSNWTVNGEVVDIVGGGYWLRDGSSSIVSAATYDLVDSYIIFEMGTRDSTGFGIDWDFTRVTSRGGYIAGGLTAWLWFLFSKGILFSIDSYPDYWKFIKISITGNQLSVSGSIDGVTYAEFSGDSPYTLDAMDVDRFRSVRISVHNTEEPEIPEFAPIWSINPTFPIFDFTHKRKITIDKDLVAGDLTNFPVYMDVTLNSNVTSTSGYDVVFKDLSDNPLSFDLEDWDNSTKRWRGWVKIPSLSSTVDTEIWVHYGDSSITTNQSSPATWSRFRHVWSLSEPSLGSGAMKDRTFSANHMSNTGTKLTANVAGKLTKSVERANDSSELSRLETDENVIFAENSSYTILGWLYKTANTPTNGQWIWQMESGRIRSHSNNQTWRTYTASSNSVQASSGSVSNDSWHRLAVIHSLSAATLTSFVDGNDITTTSITSTNKGYMGTATPFALFGSQTLSQLFPGRLSHVFIATEVLGADWIETDFHNQNDPTSFYSVGSEESGSGGGQEDIDNTLEILSKDDDQDARSFEVDSMETILDGTTYEAISRDEESSSRFLETYGKETNFHDRFLEAFITVVESINKDLESESVDDAKDTSLLEMTGSEVAVINKDLEAFGLENAQKDVSLEGSSLDNELGQQDLETEGFEKAQASSLMEVLGKEESTTNKSFESSSRDTIITNINVELFGSEEGSSLLLVESIVVATEFLSRFFEARGLGELSSNKNIESVSKELEQRSTGLELTGKLIESVHRGIEFIAQASVSEKINFEISTTGGVFLDGAFEGRGVEDQFATASFEGHALEHVFEEGLTEAIGREAFLSENIFEIVSRDLDFDFTKFEVLGKALNSSSKALEAVSKDTFIVAGFFESDGVAFESSKRGFEILMTGRALNYTAEVIIIKETASVNVINTYLAEIEIG